MVQNASKKQNKQKNKQTNKKNSFAITGMSYTKIYSRKQLL